MKFSISSVSTMLIMLLSACGPSPEMGDGSARIVKHSSQYDPMVDAAPGDDRPSVPSVNGVTPEQATGNNTSDIAVPGANMGGVGRR